MKVVATSGYYDCLHCGHVESFKKAKELGDFLLVFVDSDRKAINKKGFVLMPEKERVELVQSIKYVNHAVVVDTSIAGALKKYKPQIFAKGGDRTIANIPQEEIDICNQYNIEIVCGLGEKIQSSSNLIDNSSIYKPWGKYIVLHTGLNYLTKKIIVNPHSRLSLQYHNNRDEFWTVTKGNVEVTLNNNVINLTVNNSIFIPRNSVHRISNTGDGVAEIIEVQTGLCDENDIVRVEDDYKRAK